MGLATADDLATEKPFVPNNRWALVIGAANYSDEIGKLQYPAKEARDFVNELTGRLAFEPENIRLLADGGKPPEAPTSAHILASLDSLLADKRLDKANLFVFYFSGHGVGTPKGDFLLPSDVDPDRIEEMGVPVKKVIARIVDAGLRNVLFIADACRSGRANDFGAELTEQCRRANIAVILGCAPGRRSYEYPELRGGVFTHFLIEDLNKPELRDESGSLWASRVGEQVQKEVHAYTEPDHGESAQSPALWAERSTLDVLLAVYPQKPISDKAAQEFQRSVEKLNKQEFANAMTEFGAEMVLAGRFDQCVDPLKAVDQLGELSPVGRYLLAMSLRLSGRLGEAERVFGSFVDEAPGYYRDLALVGSNSRAISPRLRVDAATRIFQTDPAWADRRLAWIAVMACGSYEEQVLFTRRFAALQSVSERQRLYAQGCLADVEGRWRDAIANYRKALNCPGERPLSKDIFLGLTRASEAVGGSAGLENLADQFVRIKGCEVRAYLRKADIAREQGATEARVSCIRECLKHDPDPDELWEAAKIAGPHIGAVLTELRQVAGRFPYSWRARMLLSLLNAIAGDEAGSSTEFTKSEIYREDPLTFNSEIFGFMEPFLEEALRLGRIKELDYRRRVDIYFLTLLRSAGAFGYDPNLWLQFTQLGLTNERNAQVVAVASRFVPFRPEAAPKELRPMLIFLGLNSGDSAMIERLHTVKFEPGELDDPEWFYAAYLATRGREREAATMLPKLRPPSWNLLPRMEALKTYLFAKTGREAQARSRLKAKAVDDLVVRGFDGLAWAALGDWKRAEPLLAEQARSLNWAFLFVSECSMRTLDKRYRSTGRLREARGLALGAGSAQPGNPLFEKYTFAEKPGVAQFAGATTMDCVIEDDIQSLKSLSEESKRTYAIGKLTFTVTAAGALSGAFNDGLGHDYHFEGKVDPLGNVRGRLVWKDRKFSLAAKIAPPSFYKSDPRFKSIGQAWQFIDDQGWRLRVTGLPGL